LLLVDLFETLNYHKREDGSNELLNKKVTWYKFTKPKLKEDDIPLSFDSSNLLLLYTYPLSM